MGENRTIKEIIEDKLSYSTLRNIQKVIDYIVINPDKFSDAVDLSFSDENPVAWHTAWVIDHLTDKNTDIFKPFLNESIEHIKSLATDSQLRIYLRIINKYDIPEQYEVLLYDYCKELILSSEKAVGIKANAMRILKKICTKYPELTEEIKQIITELLPLNTKPAFIHSAKKLFEIKK